MEVVEKAGRRGGGKGNGGRQEGEWAGAADAWRRREGGGGGWVEAAGTPRLYRLHPPGGMKDYIGLARST